LRQRKGILITEENSVILTNAKQTLTTAHALQAYDEYNYAQLAQFHAKSMEIRAIVLAGCAEVPECRLV
jgi:hypothetical protein